MNTHTNIYFCPGKQTTWQALPSVALSNAEEGDTSVHADFPFSES